MNDMKTAATILADIKGYAGANRISFSGHSGVRMGERGGLNGVQYADIQHALTNATGIRKGNVAGRWAVEGKDRDGDDLTVVCVIEDGVVVVTVF